AEDGAAADRRRTRRGQEREGGAGAGGPPPDVRVARGDARGYQRLRAAMNLRLAIYDWIARYELDQGRGDALFRVAGYADEPAAVARRFWPAVAVLAGALGGLGVILWIAANWQDFGRMGRFALLQGA